MGPLAQIGLALATAAGAWINLLLVIGFAVRAGYLEFDRGFVMSLLKFAVVGSVLAAALWLTAHVAATQFAAMTTLRDEATLALLMAVTLVVYGALIMALFGRSWLRSLVRAK